MCNRYWVQHELEKIEGRFVVGRRAFPDDEPVRREIYPGYAAPIIYTAADGVREIALAHWGLVPPWVKEVGKAIPDRLKPNNARDDTIAKNLAERKGMFYSAMKSGRCILPATGWCEWTGEVKGQKVAHELCVQGADLFAFAGLWATRREEPTISCTMITTEPNDFAIRFHHRMPVVLRDEDVAAWLDSDVPPEAVMSLLTAYPAEALIATPGL